ELKDLSDVSKAENLENLLKKSQEDALRILRDKTELYVDGDNIIALGKHKFTVNKQPLSLTLIRRNNELYYHLTGTSFFQEVKSSEILAYQDIWEQELVSENNEVYRAEYLAYQTLLASRGQTNFNAEQFINQTVEQNYTENYIKGVHNVDALSIYLGLAEIDNKLDLLRFDSKTRAIAQLFWHELEVDTRDKLAALIQATAAVMRTFPNSKRSEEVIKQISKSFHQWPSSLHLEGMSPANIANYIFQTFAKYKRFTLSETADHFRQEFLRLLENKKVLKDYEQDINQERFKNEDRYLLITNWLFGYIEQEEKADDYARYIEETAAALLFPKDDYELIFANDRLIVDDLKGNHPSISEGRIDVQYHSFIAKLKNFVENKIPRFQSFTKLKEELNKNYAKELKINELEPKVLTSFVRNKLINEVYFPLIGSNLAKQIGEAGDNKRTARMGMLLLISPPGYGKTTLMEYLAKTIGFHFVK